MVTLIFGSIGWIFVALVLGAAVLSMVPRIGSHPGQRTLIYDAKQEILGLLGGMDLRCRIDLLNPLDSRLVAWDMATDVT